MTRIRGLQKKKPSICGFFVGIDTDLLDGHQASRLSCAAVMLVHGLGVNALYGLC